MRRAHRKDALHARAARSPNPRFRLAAQASQLVRARPCCNAAQASSRPPPHFCKTFYAKANRLVSQPHFLSSKYASPSLGVLVAVVDVIALVPYLVLQFKGLGIIVATTSYGIIAPAAAIWIGAIIVTAYVTVSGMRGSAWNSVAKDLMILGVVVFLGIYLPIHYYGGLGQMFQTIDAAKPGFLSFPDKGASVAWSQSTVLLTALGFFMWPHTFASVFTARDERIFRRNAAVLPIYQLILLFVFFVGFAATLKVPGLKGSDIDLSLFRLSLQTFDPWFVAVVAITTLTHASIGQWFPFLPERLKDLNIGLAALALNVVVLVVVSALTQASRTAGQSQAQSL